MTQVAILWHMHQPFYEDLVTREHILPWVRLHALKDYFGMVALLREFPEVRLTFNLVPSLLVQLEAFAEDRARDRFLDLGLKPAAELTDADTLFILQNFFHAAKQRMIDVHPRYADLLSRRGMEAPSAAEARDVAQRFTVDDLRDLQVWQKLVWIDQFYLDDDPRVRALVAKERQFTEDDKRSLRGVELEILNRVIPEYRAAAARGQVEIATSPFYHPILPLLCDTDVYLRTHPQSRMPRQRFVHPEDAAEQLQRAIACHERLFGRCPIGLWPSEGSVSDAVVRLASSAGFKWMATDELILARTLGVAIARDGHGHVEQPERLYTPYTVRVGDARMACAFRDHALSDLIGFSYSGWRPETAADDFVARLAEAGRRFSARTGGEEAVIPIVLDGENAWEYFEGNGRAFLRSLYRRLSSHPELRTVTMAEACSAPSRELTGIFPGSWIDANFYIWIGHADDQRAWNQLADARQALTVASGIGPAEALAQAREEILVAEGSDWFWWYGDDHSSAHDAEFDDLFRRHLRNAYRMMNQAVPEELFASNITTAASAPTQTMPSGFLAPTLDGEVTSYLEWMGAGRLEVRESGGTMHEADRPESLLTVVHFGFGRQHLFVRLDAARPLSRLLAEGYGVSLKFLSPAGVRFSIRRGPGGLAWAIWERRQGTDDWVDCGARGTAVALGDVIEAAIPLADLRLAGAAAVSFFVVVYDAAGREVERHPGRRPLEADVPDERFEARNWTV
jgi:alpha-amylase/alpha-mannosidase (GH57 family)